MIEENLDIIYNLDYVVCLPKTEKELKESFEYSFGNIFLFDNTVKGVRIFTDFVKKNNIKKIILVDFVAEYKTIINKLYNLVSIDIIFTKSLAALSDPNLLMIWDGVISLYQKGNIGKIGIFDKGLYSCLKKQDYPVYFIQIDMQPESIQEKGNAIGLLNYDYDPKHSFYNEMSAIALTHYKDIKILSATQLTKDFMHVFDIEAQECETMDELMANNLLNLYVNFTNNDITLFLKSMDRGIPCILGNCSILDSFPKLKEMLVVKSDDDVNEIASKIEFVAQNRDKVLKAYKPFRKRYSEDSKNSIYTFTNKNRQEIKEEKEEKLLTVVVPIYNVEKFVADSLDSILNAKIDNMEILLINDGSTDKSEEMVRPYIEKYPDLIRYIRQTNHGLGHVRNVGLKYAKGKYIASIDSDDTIDSHFFKEAQVYMEKDIDVILCDWLSVFPTESSPTPALDSLLKLENQYKGLLYSTIMPSTCNKIVKKSLYKDMGLEFVEKLKFEDLGTNPIIMLKAKTIKYIAKPYYHYMIRENSIMRTDFGYDMIDILKILEERLQKYIGENSSVSLEELKAYVFYFRVEDFIFNKIYQVEDKKKRKEAIMYITKNIYDLLVPLLTENKYVQKLLKPIDDETKTYLEKRNKALKNKKLDSFINKALENNDYYILTPPLILYQYDNREK